MEVSVTNATVKHVLNNGDSVTVPGGETWIVDIVVGSNGNSNVTGYEINSDEIQLENANVTPTSSGYVLPAGTTVATNRSDSTVIVTGYVAEDVENTPVFENFTESDGTSVTVPSGETWDVSIFFGLNDNTTSPHGIWLDQVSTGEVYKDSSPDAGPMELEMVLTGGDTIGTDRPNTTVHITGWRVN